ncbi:hypothetical protein K1719_039409 [Acacia pycnantha]|nr:hypothetical protein K1719_039409 [Acacia pycnantha]
MLGLRRNLIGGKDREYLGSIALEDKEEINKAFNTFYQKLFCSVGSYSMDQALSYVKKVISDMDNDSLIWPVINKEIEEAAFQIGANKAPGPDGYSCLFYQAVWMEVNREVCSMVKEFLEGNSKYELDQLRQHCSHS